MKTMKKVLAFMLALAMVVTAVPVTNAEAATTGLPKSKSYYAGKTYTLKLTTPSSWKSVSTKWSATNNNTKAVAISNKKAKSVTVKALKKGKAVVTAKVTYKKGGVATTKTYKCNVKVKAPTISASPKQVELSVGETQQLTVKYVPASAIVSYKTSNADVATVTKDGLIKAVSAKDGGEAVITAVLRCGKKVKESPVKVVVNAVPGEDGLSAKVTNYFDTVNYPDVVVKNDNDGVKIAVYYGAGGKGFINEYVRLSWKYAKVYNPREAYQMTDANGFAYFTIPFSGVDADVISYTLTADGDKSLKVEGKVTVGTVAFTSDVENINGSNDKNTDNGSDKKFKDDLGFKDIVVSENDYVGATKGEGVVNTPATYTNDWEAITATSRDFVASQQVSVTDEHKVGFIGGLPTITLPGENPNSWSAESFVQPINKTSDEYHVYDEKVEWIELEADPMELTYATLNFSSLKLSKYTHMEISTHTGKEWYNAQLGATTYVYGPVDRSDFGYQIPFSDNNEHVWVKVVLKSAGQVDTAKNKGYTIKDITGVYRKGTLASADVTTNLKGASIEWKAVTPVMSVERELTTVVANQLKLADDVNVKVNDTDASTNKKIARATYKVPVYPYTGNAIITTYDKNGSVIAYFACAAENAYKTNDALNPDAIIDANATNDNAGTLKVRNYNCLSTNAFVYRISEEEAFKQVGTVSQDGTLVTVNSTEAGVTTLEGTITGVSTDAITGKVYTSVQWCPIPNAVKDNAGAIALAGQEVEIIAQLLDKNGNKVSKAGEPISFKYYEDGDLKKNQTVIADANNRVTYLENAIVNNDATIQAIDAQTSTDSKGQAKLLLCASDVAALVGITATTNSYNVAISVNGENIDQLDLYWVNGVSKYVDNSMNGNVYVNKDVTTGVVPTVGEKWEYGFTTTAVREDDQTERLPNAGVWKNYVIKRVENMKMTLAEEAGSTGTVTTNTGKNGMALVTSTENSESYISSTTDGTPVEGTTISFVIRNKDDASWSEKTVATVGKGIANEEKMTLTIAWESTGLTGKFITASGSKADIADDFTVVFKVTDSFGNINTTDVVDVTSSISGSIKTVTSGAGTAVNDGTGLYKAVADNKGLVKITLNKAGKTDKLREIITVKVNGVAQKIQIVWTAAGAVVLDPDLKDANGKYRTYADDKRIVLTFTDNTAKNYGVNINASTVDKSQFAVRRNGELADTDIASVTVSGNRIILTFKNPYTDNLKKTFTVTFSAASDGRVITSAEGKKFTPATPVTVNYTNN